MLLFNNFISSEMTQIRLYFAPSLAEVRAPPKTVYKSGKSGCISFFTIFRFETGYKMVCVMRVLFIRPLLHI